MPKGVSNLLRHSVIPSCFGIRHSSLESMIADLRFAFRMLLKAPGFTIIAILTLALGIGANSAIFSVANAVLFRPLPFPNPDELVMVWRIVPHEGGGRDVDSYPNYVDFRDQSKTLKHLAAFRGMGAVLEGNDEALGLDGIAVTSDIFDVLGVSPFLGRRYTRAEDNVDARVVVLTYEGWHRVFAADPKIVGRQVTLSSRLYTIIGVMPAGWHFPVQDLANDFLMPLEPIITTEINRRGSHSYNLVGRLKPGVSTRAAEAELNGIANQLALQYPDTNFEPHQIVIGLHSDVVAEVRPALLILLGAVALVLLIACANVANLLLARAASRSREIAIRTALGASRTLVIRQLLCESLLLALLGGTAGLFLAWWGIDLLGVAVSSALPHLGPIKIDLSVSAFTFALAIGSTVLFGLIPALQVSRPNVNESLQLGTKGSTGGLQTNRLRSFLVISQVSLSLLLLASAGLLIKSFFNLRATNPGFDSQRLMTLEISLPRVRYPELDQQVRAFDAVMAQISSIPGVESAGGANPLPLGGGSVVKSFMVGGAAPLPRGNHPRAGYLIVKPDYFQAMRIPLLQGRAFTRADTKDSPLAVMINEAFAHKHFPDRNPIGQQILIDRGEGKAPPCEVVGVVGNSRHDSLAAPPVPEIYVPFSQDPSRTLQIVLRVASTKLIGLDAEVKRAVSAVDKDLFVPALEPMSSLLTAQLAQPCFNMMLLAIFAGVAMALAAIGIYGVIAYSVTQRTREIGIRMALGAQRTQMLRLVLRQSLTLVAMGIAIGFLVALGATRVMATLLYGVGANDLSIYVAVIALLSVAAFLASYIPARRAMRVDPMVALRYE
jgi:putative ABC transport system permease protein